MSQISPPIRIVLVAAIGLIAAWMLVLRPQAEVTPPPATAPGVTGLSSAVDGAKAAGDAQSKRDAAVRGATDPETGASTGTGVTPVQKAGENAARSGRAGEAAPAKGLPADVRRALKNDKILVLGFFNPKGADDRAVRRTLADVDRWGGEVVVRSADVERVARYGAITRGAEVQQSPSVVVVDRDAKAETLVGFQDVVSIDQAVVDAMRASGGIIQDRYLSAINSACATAGVQTAAIPEATRPGDIRPAVKRSSRVWKRFVTRFAAVKAPAKWRGLKRASLTDAKAMSANYAAWVAYLGTSPAPAKAVGSVGRFGTKGSALVKSFNARMDKHNVLSCGAQT